MLNGTELVESFSAASPPRTFAAVVREEPETAKSEAVLSRTAVLGSGAGVAPPGGLAPLHRGNLTERERNVWRRFSRAAALILAVLALVVVVRWRLVSDASRDPSTGTYVGCSYPYFVLCLCGGLVTGLAHVAVTPIDVVKCRIQVGEYGSFATAFRDIFETECHHQWRRAVPVFFRGWVPSTFGYCSQGAVKFCLYEMLKCALLRMATTSDKAPSTMLQTLLFLTASFVAEVVADLALAPWEVLKLKVQTTPHGVQAVSVLIPRMWLHEGWRGFYGGLVPLWCRQVPLTMMKFASFEHIARLIRGVWQRLLGVTALSSAVQLIVTIQAGVLAGILCAVVSHPADTVLSKLSMRKTDRELADFAAPGDTISACRNSPTEDDQRTSEPVLSAGEVVRLLGWSGLWRGLGPRIAMVATITSLQWFLYDTFKVMVGLPASSASTPQPTRPPVLNDGA